MSSGPLLSWDIFMTGYQNKISRIKDLKDLNKISWKNEWIVNWDFEEILLRRDKVVLVTDQYLSIRFASGNMIDMNGYRSEEVEGKSPSIFQGPGTSDKTKEIIRKAINELQPFQVSMLNYRKNGSTYECEIEGYPVFNKTQKHSHFIAFENLIAV